ncbi:cAMP-responsive element modulator isoform X2 [Engystomops pustulosus]|uniref:cAMP-responsive element modulator isoform X2 n=1 Tax=Engystomops pustulosus TaxID=76066 RepID=UPI003AFA7FA8
MYNSETRLTTMEFLESQHIGDVLNNVSECDSINVCDTPPSGKKKVKIVEPWEFIDSPAAGDGKKERRPLKGILKNLSCEALATVDPDVIQLCSQENRIESPLSNMAYLPQWHPLTEEVNERATPETIQLCKENEIQSSLPLMECPQQWHPLSPETDEKAVLENVQLSNEKNNIQSCLPPMARPPPWHPLSAGPNGIQGLPAGPMSYPGAPESGAMVPCVGLAGVGAPFFIPHNGVLVPAATGEMPAHQIHTPGSGLPQGIVVAASSTTLHIPQQMAEEATRKREMRLMKNREAARECRKKKKEYVKCLENRVAVLENQNKTLIEELKALKDLYCHKAE